MKLLVEDHFQDNLLCESDGKSYYVEGVFATIGVRNKNGRLYSRAIWEPEVLKFQEKIKQNSVDCLGEWNHPYNPQIDPIKSVIKIVDLHIEGNKIIGKAKVLENGNNPIISQIKALIGEGIRLGISSRGVGNVDSNNNVTEFKLITFDLVSQPSDLNANNLKGIKESLQEEYDYIDGKIVKACENYSQAPNSTNFDADDEKLIVPNNNYTISSSELKNEIIKRINNY